jgi:hypothetical protein
VLHRLPARGGHDYWAVAHGSGAISRPEAPLGFSDLAENQTELVGILAQGIEHVPFG